MRTNADGEDRGDRELSVQELETVTGGAKPQENQEQPDAAKWRERVHANFYERRLLSLLRNRRRGGLSAYGCCINGSVLPSQGPFRL